MEKSALIQLGIIFGMLFCCWFASGFINLLKKKKRNTELWATIFEGITHKTMNLDPLKTPTAFIEKKARRSGQDKDAVDSDLNEEKVTS